MTSDPGADLVLRTLFGDLAELFGLSRPAGLCLAAVWRQAQPPCADDLVATLGLSRSNVSVALKELRGWSLVGTARIPGDRKEYLTAPPDPWDLLRLLIAGRQRLHVAPLLDRLLQGEADHGDIRLAALHEVLSKSAGALAALVTLGPDRLAERVGAIAESEGGKGGKPKKKKKKA